MPYSAKLDLIIKMGNCCVSCLKGEKRENRAQGVNRRSVHSHTGNRNFEQSDTHLGRPNADPRYTHLEHNSLISTIYHPPTGYEDLASQRSANAGSAANRQQISTSHRPAVRSTRTSATATQQLKQTERTQLIPKSSFTNISVQREKTVPESTRTQRERLQSGGISEQQYTVQATPNQTNRQQDRAVKPSHNLHSTNIRGATQPGTAQTQLDPVQIVPKSVHSSCVASLSDCELVIMTCKLLDHAVCVCMDISEKSAQGIGSKIRILKRRRNTLPKDIIESMWYMNNNRRDMVHGSKPATLTDRQKYVTEFKRIMAALPNKESIDQTEVKRLSQATRRQRGSLSHPEALSDCDLAVMVSKEIEQSLTATYSLSDEKTKTLGDKIMYLVREELLENATIKQLKRLNWMRNRIVHDYNIQELENRQEFLRLYQKITATFR